MAIETKEDIGPILHFPGCEPAVLVELELDAGIEPMIVPMSESQVREILATREAKADE